MERKTIIGVIGSAAPTAEGYRRAVEVGRLIAEAGTVLVCGGLGGVMEGASRGCAEAGGLVLGLLPGPEPDAANRYVSLAVPTNLGHARNIVIAHAAEVLIAIEGEYGTLSEAAIALKLGRPVIGLDFRHHLDGVVAAATPEQAVSEALRRLTDRRSKE